MCDSKADTFACSHTASHRPDRDRARTRGGDGGGVVCVDRGTHGPPERVEGQDEEGQVTGGLQGLQGEGEVAGRLLSGGRHPQRPQAQHAHHKSY